MSNSDSGVESCSGQSNEDMSVGSASGSASESSGSPSPVEQLPPIRDWQWHHHPRMAPCPRFYLMPRLSTTVKETAFPRFPTYHCNETFKQFKERCSVAPPSSSEMKINQDNVNTFGNPFLFSMKPSASEQLQFQPIDFSTATVQLPHSSYKQYKLINKSASANSLLKSRMGKLEKKIRSRADTRKLFQKVYVNDSEGLIHLMRQKVDPNGDESLKKHTTPLHVASGAGYVECVEILLQNGADPNRKDSVGNTAIHLAVIGCHVGVVTLLLKAGTDLKQIDFAGRTPLQIAQLRLRRLKEVNHNYPEMKAEVVQIVEMIQTYLQKAGQAVDTTFLSLFTSQLNFHHTEKEVDDDVQHLLSSLDCLDIGDTKK